jgi:aspartate kinase
MDKIRIGGILQNAHLARISLMNLPKHPGTAAALFSAMQEARINIQFIVQCLDHNNDAHIVLCVDRDDLGRALKTVGNFQAELCPCTLEHDPNIASIGIFRPDFRVRPGIASTLLSAFAAAAIYIQAISTSVSTAAAIIAADQLPTAVEVIQKAFELP